MYGEHAPCSSFIKQRIHSLSDRKNNNYHDRSGANFSARIAALSDNSSRMAKSAELRY